MIDKPKNTYLNPVEFVRLSEKIISIVMTDETSKLDIHLEVK